MDFYEDFELESRRMQFGMVEEEIFMIDQPEVELTETHA